MSAEIRDFKTSEYMIYTWEETATVGEDDQSSAGKLAVSIDNNNGVLYVGNVFNRMGWISPCSDEGE